ncbi:hypothetical protein QAD02_001146 [Eretmocerus hayati]|uniref:Uncharacterized protein n=1 Tax=Eretmocerus hayati TaxID=131215 RepID=A0ACC2NFF6_9HYME|nr:hypothetical protein QAD02_001146 [Eretmocerus hayati]
MVNQQDSSSSSKAEFSKSITSFYGETVINVQKYKYTWVIKNFADCYLEIGKSVKSPVYAAWYDNVKYEFIIYLYPSGYSSSSLAEPVIEFMTIEECKPIVKSSEEHVNFLKAATFDFETKNLKDHLFDGNLIVQMEMLFKGAYDISAVNPSASLDIVTKPEHRLLEFDDFENLFVSGDFSDLTLIVGKQEYHVHKSILSARSPVFHAMFKHDMRENQENILNIPDVEPHVMEEILRYIYAGKVSHMDRLDSDLFLAADKYCITGLKNACETLIYNLSLDNVGNALTLMDHCKTNKLAPVVLEFITDNSKTLKNDENFKETINRLSPALLRSVIDVMMSKL